MLKYIFFCNFAKNFYNFSKKTTTTKIYFEIMIKKSFKQVDYEAPQVELIRFCAPLNLLIGMSAESDLFGDYSDEGELIDATEYDKLNGGN